MRSLCSGVSLSSSEGTNLDERSTPYQICVDLSASPSSGDLTVSITSTGTSATCKIIAELMQPIVLCSLTSQLQMIFSFPLIC